MSARLPRLVLYTRSDCHLCEVAKTQLLALRRRVAFDLEERDVDSRPSWRRRFGDEVPVGVVGDQKAFKYRVDVGRVRRLLLAVGAPPAP